FRAFSDDLCEGWIEPLAEPVLASGGVPGYYNFYRRTDNLCGAESYEAVTNAKPQNFAEHNTSYRIELQGISADGKVAAFAANDSLEGTGAPGAQQVELYVSGEGEGPPRFVCVLPGGAPSAGPCSAGGGRE